jgi:ribose transport system permease protein
LLAVIFSLWNPSTFGTADNARIIASSEAITGILTLGLIVSLLSGMFDVSVAANMSLAISLVGWLQSNWGMNPALAVALTLSVGALIGATNAFIITKLRVEPVIATLGMSSILAAMAYWIAHGNTIIDGISPRFKDFGSSKLLTIPVPVFYLLGVAVVLWYLLDHTPTGRYMYATGANVQAARLAGVNVVRLQWASLMIAGTLASFAGIVLTMQLGASSFGAGNSYLLPAFAAAFLGSTQIRPGRFNVLGTLVALYLLAIGVKGLQLEYPSLPWIKDLFEGVTLIFAVALGARAAVRRARR